MALRKQLDVDARLREFLQCARGIVRTAELQAIGLKNGQIAYLTRTGGGWTRVYPGVYATFTGELTRTQKIRAAMAYAGRGAVLTGYWALDRRGIKALPSDQPIHLLIPHDASRQSQQGLRIERTTRMPEPDLIDGIRVASTARAAIDAARHCTDTDAVRHLIGVVIRLRRATVQDLTDELVAGPVRGSAKAREALGGAARGVRGAEEARLRARMLAVGLPEPQWNVHLYDREGNWVAYVDGFLEGVAFEMQTRAFHLYVDRWEPDIARLSRLNSFGVMVQLATPRFLRNSWDEFEADVRRALASGVGAGSQLVVGDPPYWWGQRAA